MTAGPLTTDLVVLVADGHAKAAIRGLMDRRESLGIRRVGFEAYVHPHHDSGVCREAEQFLRVFLRSHRFALAILDHHGCGYDTAPENVESDLQERLNANGWEGRSAVVVIAPELEVWVWSHSPNITRPLGWSSHAELMEFLRTEQLWPEGAAKPPSPQQALDAVLAKAKQPRSSTLFEQLAQTVSLQHCQDRAFLRLCDTLRAWFPAG
jgi:hypothetical protein